MSTRSRINIIAENSVENEAFELYSSSVWDDESESVLFQTVLEILQLIRPVGKKIQVNITIEVTDQYVAISRINKKLKKEVIINNQKLTIREIEVLGLIMQGFNNKQISEKLFISFETVRSHRKNILRKTGAKNTAVLINHYHQTFFDK